MPDRHYDPQCPICLQDVDTLQPDYYRVLAMHPEHAELLHEKPRFKIGTISILDTLQAKSGQTTDGTYTERVWLLHTRCLELVRELPIPKLYLLVDLIAPTFVSWKGNNDSASKHGAFYSSQLCQPSKPIVTPRPPQHHPIWEIMKAFWNAIWSSPSEDKVGLPYRLPRDVWNMVQKHDISRLFFVMHTAGQLSKLDDGILNPSNERFTISTLSLKSDLVRIHLVNIGCRTYIRRFSDPTESHTDIPGSSSNGVFWNVAKVFKPFFQVWKRCITAFQSLMASGRVCQAECLDHKLNGSHYLAVKFDEIGIMDIAFGSTEDGIEWILNNRTNSTPCGVSKVKNARVQGLVMVSDV